MPVFDNNGAVLDQICDTMSSSAWMPNNFSEQQLDLAVPAISSDCKMGFYGAGGIAGFQNFNSRYQPHVGDQFGEECCGFVEDVKPPPAYNPNAATENWGTQGNQIAAVEEPNIKVGRYSLLRRRKERKNSPIFEEKKPMRYVRKITWPQKSMRIIITIMKTFIVVIHLSSRQHFIVYCSYGYI